MINVLDLRSVRGTGGGPEKTILAGAVTSPGTDVHTTVCYLRDARDVVFHIDARAKALDVDYCEIVERHSFDPTVWPRLKALIRARGIQIVHAHDYKTDLLTLMLGRSEEIVPLATAHAWVGDSVREQLYYAADKRLLARYPHVIAVSEDIKTELVRTGTRPDRVTVIPNGIDHRTFVRQDDRRESVRQSLGFGNGEAVIGSVGRLEEQKRFDLLIDTFHSLFPRHPRLRLVIAGDGERRDELDDQIRRLGLNDSCVLLGHREDVIDLHHGFDLFVQSSDREGTSNAVLEAMALETPVVATDAGGTRELITDTVHGLIVPPGDGTLLARAIEQTLGDRAAARARARAARHRVETELSFDARMGRVQAIYRDLVAQRAA